MGAAAIVVATVIVAAGTHFGGQGNSPGYTPRPTTIPSVSGTVTVGEALSCGTGVWINSPDEYSISWESSSDGTTWSQIATGSPYLVATGDETKTLRCSVTALKSGASALASSSAVGPVPAPNPLLIVSDTFTDTDTTVLSSHVGEVGATWTRHVDHPGADTTATITAGRLHGNGSTSTLSRYYASGVPSNADYDVVGTLVAVSAVTNDITGIWGRLVTNTDNGYACRYNQSISGFQLLKVVSGSVTTLATYSVSFPPGSSLEAKLEMRGSAIKCYVDGVERMAATDSTFSAAGGAGVMTRASTATTGIHIDSMYAALPEPAQCADGLDNDGDTFIDFPDDVGCASATDDDEFNAPPAQPQCNDGIDNDGDTKIDYPADNLGCVDAADDDETDPPPPPPPVGDGANVFVSSTGSDTGSNCVYFTDPVEAPADPSTYCLTFNKAATFGPTATIDVRVEAGTYAGQRVSVRTRTAVATIRPASGASVTAGCRTTLSTTTTFSGSSNTVDVSSTACFTTTTSPCSPVASPCSKMKIGDATINCSNSTKTATGWTGCNLEACSSNTPCKFYAGTGVYDNNSVGLLIAGTNDIEIKDITAPKVAVFTEVNEPSDIVLRNLTVRDATLSQGNGVSLIAGTYGNEHGSGAGKAIQVGAGIAEAGPTAVTIDGVRVEEIDDQYCGRTGSSGCHTQGIKIYPTTALTIKNSTIVSAGTFGIFIESNSAFTVGLTLENNFLDLPHGVCGGNTLGDGNDLCRGATSVVFKYKNTGATFANQTIRHNSVGHNGTFLLESGNTYSSSTFAGNIVEKLTPPAGWTTSYNLFEGTSCTGTNVCVTDTSTTEFTSDTTANFHLKVDAFALAMVGSGCLPAFDIDVDARPATNCDAGADES
jgi:hypothetical protein